MKTQPIIILSMHRSGSSALTGVLNHLGVHTGGNLIPPAPDNPKGFFENRKIVIIHDELLNKFNSPWDSVVPLPENWTKTFAAQEAKKKLIIEITNQQYTYQDLWVIKDPRMCKVLPLWKDILKEIGLKPKYILCNRNVDEVVASLYRRNRMDRVSGYMLWCHYLNCALSEVGNDLISVVNFDDLLSNIHNVVDKIEKDLEIKFPVCYDSVKKELSEFLDCGLKKSNFGGTGVINIIGETINGINSNINRLR